MVLRIVVELVGRAPAIAEKAVGIDRRMVRGQSGVEETVPTDQGIRNFPGWPGGDLI